MTHDDALLLIAAIRELKVMILAAIVFTVAAANIVAAAMDARRRSLDE